MVEFVAKAGKFLFQVLHLSAELLLALIHSGIRGQCLLQEFGTQILFLFVDIMSQLIQEFIFDDELVLEMLRLCEK